MNIKPYGALPSKRQINHFKNFGKKAFFHFGVNTFSNLEWGEGNEMESLFNPTETDVRQWIKVVKAAGFELAILTVTHHDGFCLWPTAFSEHSIKNSPYKNGEGDILREFTDACREFDIAAGIYISPWDRHSKLWGSPEYSEYFNNQLKEVLSGYGKIDEVWWDAAGSKETPYDWGLWAHTVRNLQPDAVMFGSLGATEYVEMRWIGNEGGVSSDPHYPTVNFETLSKEIRNELNSGVFGGERFVIAEADTSIRPGWFYHKEQDEFVKTPKELVDLWFNSVGNSAVMLLNFPPDRRGLVHEIDAKNAIEANNIINKALSVNYALNAEVTADSVKEGHPADNIINGNYNAVYAAEKNTSVINIKLDGKKTFDTFIIGEYIELGIRINGFKVEVKENDNWKLVSDKKSVGFKKAVYIGEHITDEIRVTVYSAADVPVIREFGLYNFKDSGYDVNEQPKESFKNIDLAKNPSARAIYEKDGATVMLGGLFPFNTIVFNGKGISSYKLLIFNGSQFYVAKEGVVSSDEVVITLDETIKTSYQFKILTEKEATEEINIRVYRK